MSSIYTLPHLVGSLGHKLGLELLHEVEEEVVLEAEGLLTHDCLHRHHVLALKRKNKNKKHSEQKSRAKTPIERNKEHQRVYC